MVQINKNDAVDLIKIMVCGSYKNNGQVCEAKLTWLECISESFLHKVGL